MKNQYLLIFFLFTSVCLFGQSPTKVLSSNSGAALMIVQPSPDYTILESQQTLGSAVQFRDVETQIGSTYFDTQTIGSLGRRVGVLADGRISAAWLFGADEANGWPDRGAAYNHFNGTEWAPIPTSSLEITRSGYPSFGLTPNGLEVVLSHKSETGMQWFLQANTKMPEESNWVETEIPSTVPGGPVWAKIATGGPNGNTIHSVAVSVAPDFGGEIYEGINQHPLYYRSTDGGDSWDMVDVIIPGLDSNFYSNIFGEGYNIDANGETVAIALFESWGDIAVAKSIDNGATWTKTIVKDFPLDKYDGSGYGPDDIPFDPNAPDSVSILTNDSAGSVLVDNDGKVHVFFGQMYVFADGENRFLFLDSDGIGYWNEDFGPDSIRTIANVEDLDGDSLVTLLGDIADYRYFNSGLTSFPSAGVDEDGNLYAVYTAIREDIEIDDNNYRHIFIIKSEDGGLTWSEPFDLINEETTEFAEFTEAAFPSIPSRIGDAIHLVYQQDFTPGLNAAGESVEQFIMHAAFDKNTFGTVSSTIEIEKLNGQVELVPNPTSGNVQLNFELTEKATINIQVFNALGKLIKIESPKSLLKGQYSENLNLENLNSGIYFIRLDIDGAVITRKLVVE